MRNLSLPEWKTWEVWRRDGKWCLQRMAQPLPTRTHSSCGSYTGCTRGAKSRQQHMTVTTNQGWAPGTPPLSAELIWPLIGSGGEPAAVLRDVPGDAGTSPGSKESSKPMARQIVSVNIRRVSKHRYGCEGRHL